MLLQALLVAVFAAIVAIAVSATLRGRFPVRGRFPLGRREPDRREPDRREPGRRGRGSRRA